jgi:hypothetical protein
MEIYCRTDYTKEIVKYIYDRTSITFIFMLLLMMVLEEKMV